MGHVSPLNLLILNFSLTVISKHLLPQSSLSTQEKHLLPQFSPSTLENLPPGGAQTIDVIYTADAANASGSYRIYSNDLDESSIHCQTNGNINGANIGDQAPDFELDIVANGNGTFRLSDYLGQVVVLAFFSPM